MPEYTGLPAYRSRASQDRECIWIENWSVGVRSWSLNNLSWSSLCLREQDYLDLPCSFRIFGFLHLTWKYRLTIDGLGFLHIFQITKPLVLQMMCIRFSWFRLYVQFLPLDLKVQAYHGLRFLDINFNAWKYRLTVFLFSLLDGAARCSAFNLG